MPIQNAFAHTKLGTRAHSGQIKSVRCSVAVVFWMKRHLLVPLSWFLIILLTTAHSPRCGAATVHVPQQLPRRSLHRTECCWSPTTALPHSLLMLFPAPKPQGTTLHQPQARRRLYCKNSVPYAARTRAEKEVAESEWLWHFAAGKGPLPLTLFVKMLIEEFCFHRIWCSPSPSLLPINK